MTAKTRHGESGYGIRRAGSFAGKTPSAGGGGSGHPVALITRPAATGHATRRAGSFAGKTLSGGGGGGSGAHPVSRITRPMPGGFGGRRCGSFAGKTSSGGGGGGGGGIHPVSRITRPIAFGFGGRRCGSFAGKTAGSGGGSSARPNLSAFSRLAVGYGASLNGSFTRSGGIARPSSDSVLGGWLPSTGSVLFDMLDETTADSSDYIYTNSAGDVCEVALSAVLDPETSSGQVASYQAWSPVGDGLTVRLMQGATVIATWTHATLPTSPTVFHRILTAIECDSITDYSALSFQFES